MTTRAAAADRLLGYRRAWLAVLERDSRWTRAVESDLAYVWRLYRLGELRVAQLRERAR